MKARHSARSFTTSCQLGSSARSLLRTSIHLSSVPPGLLCFPCGRHLSTCFWSRWSDILCTWPSHCNRLCLSWTSIGSSLVSSRMSAFRRMSHRVTPTMSRRHLIWNPLPSPSLCSPSPPLCPVPSVCACHGAPYRLGQRHCPLPRGKEQ